jgi:hypothetical protein
MRLIARERQTVWVLNDRIDMKQILSGATAPATVRSFTVLETSHSSGAARDATPEPAPARKAPRPTSADRARGALHELRVASVALRLRAARQFKCVHAGSPIGARAHRGPYRHSKLRCGG